MSTKWFSRASLLALCIFAISLIAAPAAAADGTYTNSVSGNILTGDQYDLWAMDLGPGVSVVATLTCDFDGVSRPLDPVLSAFAPGVDTSDTINATFYNDDGFGSDDDANGVDCDAFDSSRIFMNANPSGEWVFRVDGFGSATGPYTLTITVSPNLNPLAADGRINPIQASQYAVYCDGEVASFYSAQGTFLFSVANGESNSGSGISVSPLADGRMQVNSTFPDGKGFLFIYDGCPNGGWEAYSVEASPTLFATGIYGTGVAEGK